MKTFSVSLEGKQTTISVSQEFYQNVDIKCSAKLLVTDTTMIKSPEVIKILEKCEKAVIIDSGEESKNLASIEKILKAAIEAELDRDSLIIGVGGGVICDMAAFAASIYMRGCKLYLVPTSLLSMVDASIGGKTGVDYMNKKNLVGSFYPAEQVDIYTTFLKTLSEKQFLSGLAEIIKHALLFGEEFLKYMEDNINKIIKRDPQILEELIFKSLKVKAEYIEKDFREGGIRTHLNYGHTFGHALEAATGLGFLTHGEAVAWGILKSVRAGLLVGITNKEYAGRIEKILKKYGYNIDFKDFEYEKFLEALKADKKKKDGRIRFVIQKNIGDTGMYPLEDAIIKEAVLQTGSLAKNSKGTE